MATEPLPLIEEDDYEAIRKIAPDLPDAFADWLTIYEGEKRERSKIGPVQEVPVRPEEFAAFCKDRGVRGSQQDLLRFARENAGPHKSEHDYDPLDRI